MEKKEAAMMMRRIGLFIIIAVSFLGGFAPSSKGDEPPILNIYNWADNIDPEVIIAFEEETGIRVNYDVYDSDEVLESKLLLGGSGYDVVFPSANPFFARQINAGIYEKIDVRRLPHYKNLDGAILKRLQEIDPGNAYGIPYFWGTIGVAYNKTCLEKAWPGANIDELAKSFKILFDPEILKHFASAGVSFQSSALDVFNALLLYQGVRPSDATKDQFKNAVETLKVLRPFIRKFTSSGLIEDLATGETCLALGWSGDVYQASLRAKELNKNTSIKYSIPKEGAEIWFEVMAIPKDAPHKENAYRFIDFILRPKIIAQITNYVYYANPNKASLPYVHDAVKNNPSIYPSADIMKRLYVSQSAPPNFERWRSRVWIRIKTGV